MFTEDLSEFLDTDGLADSAYVGSTQINGIYESAFIEVHGIEAERPIFTCGQIDSTFIEHGDLITINTNLLSDLFLENANDYIDDGYIESDIFKIVGIQPDGTGLTSLILEDT
jgi:hypothetical protein